MDLTIKTIKIDICQDVSEGAICQHCGHAVEPINQPNGISYCYTVDDRLISPSHLPAWLGMIGDATNQNVHPLWLVAKINQQEVENEIQYSI